MSPREQAILRLLPAVKRFTNLVRALDLPEPAEHWRPAHSRAFAERLILAPDDTQALSLIHAHPQEATAFMELLGELLKQVKTGEVKPRNEQPSQTTPFYSLSLLVIDFCDAIQDVDPTSYEDA